MNTVPKTDKATAIEATGKTRAAAAPRLKLTPRGVAIDHPDLALGEALMAKALGAPDCDSMYGILQQLVNASVERGKPDAPKLGFMISMVESIKPRDSVEIEALNRYRNNGAPAITVQNVSVGDGGNAIVGNITQHAPVIVSDKGPA